MSLVQLFVPTEVAHDTVAELGELGNVEFKDVSSSYLSFFFFLYPDSQFRSSIPM
jgi:V-type H+-transporting ATPase subunit a